MVRTYRPQPYWKTRLRDRVTATRLKPGLYSVRAVNRRGEEEAWTVWRCPGVHNRGTGWIAQCRTANHNQFVRLYSDTCIGAQIKIYHHHIEQQETS